MVCLDDASSGTSSGSEGNKENNPVLQTTGLTRRQKKNHRIRRDESLLGNSVKKKSSTNHQTHNGNTNGHNQSKHINGILKQNYLLGIPDFMLIQYLQNYLVRMDQLLWLGYPIEAINLPGRAFVFKHSGETVQSSRNLGNIIMNTTSTSSALVTKSSSASLTTSSRGFDINAREFIPKDNKTYNGSYCHGGENGNTYDNISKSSAMANGSSNSHSHVHSDFQRRLNDTIVSETGDVKPIHQKKCIRCGHVFYISQEGVYLTRDRCLYHWGRLKKQFHDPDISIYSCCNGKKDSKGCSTGKLHVWSGLEENIINGPLDGFVKTKPRKTPPRDGSDGLYAIDCEMCYTTHGLELAKVTVIGADGRIVYDTLVKPENEIIDYNTRFSGITARDMNKKGNCKVLKEVQNDLMGFINADTILVGHGMENDLLALKMVHTTIIDTSVVFPHYFGLPYRRSLKSLVECFLNRTIQCVSTGHDSVEDATSVLELIFWKLKNDLGNISSDYLPTNNNNHRL